MANFDKSDILKRINQILEERIKNYRNALREAIESRDNETKSSVGDKYETGRAMAQIEIDKLEAQVVKNSQSKNSLAKIQPDKQMQTSDFGSLLSTNQGIYFISVALGVVNIGADKVFCISLASPIGVQLKGKSLGDKFVFQSREYEILSIQ